MLLDLWNYRYFIFSSIRNDLFSRFARSRLRGMWMFIQPMAQVAIYALIFANLMSSRLPGIDNAYGYTVFLMAGLLAWTLFSEMTERCLSLLVEQGNLMKKMNFPRITLPAVVAGARLFSNLVLLLVMLAVFVLLGHPLNWQMLWLVPLTLLLAAFALGVGLFLGIMNVFLRDLGQVVPIFLQVWFWFTPIVYPLDIVPDGVREWLRLNPMFHFVQAYRDVVVYGRAPEAQTLVIMAVLAVVMLTLALFVFRRANNELVDAL